MKKLNKIPILFFILLLLLNLSMVTIVSANEISELPESTNESEISPRSEVTGYMYKTVNGVRYKRLWSYTYNHWIDPYWIPCD